jgi:hypothetical protein
MEDEDFVQGLRLALAAQCDGDLETADAWLAAWLTVDHVNQDDASVPVQRMRRVLQSCSTLLDADRLEQLEAEQDEQAEDDAAYQLYVAPTTARDQIHEGVALVYSRPCAEYMIMLALPLPAGTPLMRSVVRAGVRQRSGASSTSDRPDLPRCAGALARLLLRRGHLTPGAPRFAPELSHWSANLHPRRRAHDYADLVALLESKLLHNAIGALGSLDCAVLDRGSFFNHACAPNALRTLDAAVCEAHFQTLCALPCGAQALVCAIAFPVDSRDARRRLLAAAHCRFACSCRCCADDAPPSLAYAELEVLVRSRAAQAKELASQHCWWCGAPTRRQCGACQRAGYCSPECQRRNYATHRQICARLAAQAFAKVITVD